MYVCLYACMHGWMDGWMSVNVCQCMSLYVTVCHCMYVWMYVCMYASMYPCIHVSMYTCMFYVLSICPIYLSIIYIWLTYTHTDIHFLGKYIPSAFPWEELIPIAFAAHFPGKMHSPSACLVCFPGLSGAMWPISGPLQWHVVKCSISSISLGHIWAGLDTTSMYRHMPPPPQTCPP